jgi:hypothetical protein
MRKNYIDPSAGFMYAIGTTLVHFCMLITSLTVKKPDVEQAMYYE